jgi:hypothetical protein
MPAPDLKSSSKQPFISRYTIFMVLLLILILLAAGWWAVSSYQPPELPTAVVYRPSATLTPTITATSTLTPTPTRTPRPTWTIRPRLTDTPTVTPTPTLTPTPTRLPTITRAVPVRFNDRYLLIPWTADQADQAAQMADEYPDVTFPTTEGKSKSAYHAAFRASADAYREALLRFPDDPRATNWQWKLAYALAQVGDPAAAKLYAGFIQGALKKGDLRVEDLPEWFHRQEPRLTLLIDNIPAEPGQLNQDLIEIVEGGVFLWLLETPANLQVTPITEVFNFDAAPETVHLLGDLTGDGKTEVSIYQPDPDQPTILAEPRIFSLTGTEPQEQSVQPSPVIDLQTDFSASLETTPENQLAVKASLFPACPVTITQIYAWDQTQFVPTPAEIQVSPQSSYIQYCEPVLKHALSAWSAANNLALIETLLPLWPPEKDLDEQPYPADARDELLYRQGIFQALTGKSDQAVKTLQDLINAPTVSKSSWAEAAEQFLKNYQSPEDLYRACQAAPSCDLRFALEEIVRSSGATDLTVVYESLRKSGVSMRATGLFDFDQDGQSERWVTIQPRPGQSLEFWILASAPDGVRPLFVDLVTRDRPAPFYNEPAAATPPVFQIDNQKGFQLKRISGNGEPYLVPAVVVSPITTYTRDTLKENQDAILSGVDPTLVRDSLLDVLNSGRFNCLNHRICDRFYYNLGLAYELSGDVREAIDTYIKLWWENGQSPYTKIARMKIGLITPTPSPTSAVTTTGTPGSTLVATQAPPAATAPNPYPVPGSEVTPNPYP